MWEGVLRKSCSSQHRDGLVSLWDNTGSGGTDSAVDARRETGVLNCHLEAVLLSAVSGYFMVCALFCAVFGWGLCLFFKALNTELDKLLEISVTMCIFNTRGILFLLSKNAMHSCWRKDFLICHLGTRKLSCFVP